MSPVTGRSHYFAIRRTHEMSSVAAWRWHSRLIMEDETLRHFYLVDTGVLDQMLAAHGYGCAPWADSLTEGGRSLCVQGTRLA